jgi:dTDP-4-dehydrorhamnose 3,5-epimerase
MRFRDLSIYGLVEVIPKRHGDARGYFSENFRFDLFRANAAKVEFVQDNESLSAKSGTIRGLHFQTDPKAQGKLVRCLAGAILDVAVDLRQGSPSYGQWESLELRPELGNQLWIPAGFAHGFCTLLPDTLVSYKVTNYYSPEHDRGVRWDDPAIGIDWPDIADSDTLSAKDRVQPLLADLPHAFTYDLSIHAATEA